MPRGGLRPNAGRPPGAKNKAKVSITRRQLETWRKMDALQFTKDLALKLAASGQFEAAGRLMSRQFPYTIGRVEKIRGEPKHSPEQQFEFDFPHAPAAPADGKAETPDKFAGLLPN